MDELEDRARACLVGGALGDALGYPIEFLRGPFGGAPARLRPGVVSDDTQMALFTAEGLLAGGGVASVHAAYLRWLRTQTEPRAPNLPGLLGVAELWVRRAPGHTCLSALSENARTGRAPTVETPPNDSKGCGAVMRSAPFGVAARSREEAFLGARDAGVLTHGHPSGYLSAAAFAAIVHDALRGAPLDDATDAACALLARERGHEETLAAIDAARAVARRGAPDRAAVESLGGGWVGEEALAIALACALTAGDVRDALWRSVAHAGDSDSTGALTGNLLGAARGSAALPAEWLADLELREVAARLASDLVRRAR